MKLNLNTDYKENGNSTDCAIDTLCIAVDGRDSNDVHDANLDNTIEVERYVFDNYDFEADFLETATQGDLKKYLADPLKQAADLDTYTEHAKDAIRDGLDDDSKLAKAIQKAIDEQSDSDYKEWLEGDYRNWPGILKMAERKYGAKFTTTKGEVFAEIAKETIGEWIDYGNIIDGRQAKKYLEELINTDAYNAYQKTLADKEKRKKEWAATKQRKAEQADRAEAERVEKIKKLLKVK